MSEVRLTLFAKDFKAILSIANSIGAPYFYVKYEDGRLVYKDVDRGRRSMVIVELPAPDGAKALARESGLINPIKALDELKYVRSGKVEYASQEGAGGSIYYLGIIRYKEQVDVAYSPNVPTVRPEESIEFKVGLRELLNAITKKMDGLVTLSGGAEGVFINEVRLPATAEEFGNFSYNQYMIFHTLIQFEKLGERPVHVSISRRGLATFSYEKPPIKVAYLIAPYVYEDKPWIFKGEAVTPPIL